MTKWYGGVAVVLSAVMEVSNRARVTDSWLEDDFYVQKLAEAAELAMQQGDFTVAGELLDEAAGKKPSSSDLRLIQLKLAMLTVRDKFALLSQDEFRPINETYTVLYKNLNFDDQMRNDVITHIGWTAVLLDKAHPDYYFDRILEGDPRHVHALVFKTTWLLTERFDSISAGERSQTANHFSKQPGRVNGIKYLLWFGISQQAFFGCGGGVYQDGYPGTRCYRRIQFYKSKKY
ncbi:MAG: hypothetical protein H6937_07265 [Burkholderiales bacterium]|nr:hypothetical protein [Burkholderiales bacterium]MDR4516238.1 hypothetical protein [Nitrosomonas sp.]